MSTTEILTPLPETTTTGTTGAAPSLRGRLRRLLAPRPVRWRTVVVLAALMAYADGFWVTAVQNTVGAIERASAPFTVWLLSSTLMLPLHVLAVLVALGVVRRRLGGLRSAKQVVTAGLLVVAAGTLLTSGEALVSSVLDYRLQAARVQFMHALHPHGSLGTQLALTQAANDAGARYAAVAALVTNAVLVGWVLAAQGGGLVSPARTRRRRRDMLAQGRPAG
jgi:hypothetical protein